MTRRPFGSSAGEAVEAIALGLGTGASADVITYGAAIRDLVVPTARGPRRVVLGFERLEDYVDHSPSFGATVGRYANRIGRGRLTIDGTGYQLDRNEGPHHLHGGTRGFGTRIWTVATHDPRSVTLTLGSPDGDMGYPGALAAAVTYTLVEPATLRIDLTATSDAPTVVNLAHHSYFNLADAGAGDILDHSLIVSASRYTAVDADLIPTGEVTHVDGGLYDFREIRPVRYGNATEPFRYDINFVLDEPRGPAMVHAATLVSPSADLSLEVHTTEPGLQLYDGHKLAPPVPGLAGIRYGPCSGLCLEAQRFPDAPNHPGFGNPVLRPGEVYRQTTDYRFVSG